MEGDDDEDLSSDDDNAHKKKKKKVRALLRRWRLCGNEFVGWTIW
jgi:hypothetical protein